MNTDILKGSLHQLKGKIKQKWSDLTDDEIGKAEGKAEELSGLLQKKYGYKKEKADSEIKKFLDENKDE